MPGQPLPSADDVSRPPVVAVMTRAPSAPGKSRLLRELQTDDPVGLRLALLRDTLDAVAGVEALKAVLYAPADAAVEVQQALPFEARLLPQRGDTLGDRMRHGIEDLQAEGFGTVVLVGSDLPTLPAAHVVAALDRLRHAPASIVFGPSEDGGYYLVSTADVQGTVFEDIPWGSSDVLARTLAAASAAGLTVDLLPPWYDVDSVDGLRRVIRSAASSPGRHTRAWFAAEPDGVRMRIEREGL
jgi:rSAM/selenodomain-associated transferase 1